MSLAPVYTSVATQNRHYFLFARRSTKKSYDNIITRVDAVNAFTISAMTIVLNHHFLVVS